MPYLQQTKQQYKMKMQLSASIFIEGGSELTKKIIRSYRTNQNTTEMYINNGTNTAIRLGTNHPPK